MRYARAWAGSVAFFGLVAGTAFMMRPRAQEPKPITPDIKTAPLDPSTPKTNENAAAQNVEDLQTPAEILLTGSVVADSRAAISTRMPARIVQTLVQEGDAVSPGQALILLDDSELMAQVQTAEAGIRAAQTLVDKAREGLRAQMLKADTDIATALAGARQAKVKLQQANLARDAAKDDNGSERKLAQENVNKAEIAYERAVKTRKGLEELAKVGGVSRNDMEGAITQERAFYSDLLQARTQLKRLDAGPTPESSYKVALAQKDCDAAEEGVRQAEEGVRLARQAKTRTLRLADQDILSADAAVLQAKAGRTAALRAVDSMKLRSPLQGIVTESNARVGEMAQPGMTLMSVMAMGGVRIEALVSGRALSALQEGMPAELSSDTLPGRTFSAFLSAIARVAESDGRNFRVQFRLRSPVSLRPGQIVHLRLRRKQ